jgi:uncharacterized protein (DUF934 family)
MVDIIRLREDAAREWQFIKTDEALPENGYAIVSLVRLPEALAANHLAGVGVRLEPGEDVHALSENISRLGVIELNFPTFRDGRHYSSARMLRDELAFVGEIRAIGDVLVDQLHFMVRSGFDCLVLPASVNLESGKAALGRWSHVYQKASDGRKTVWQDRADA